MSSESKNIMTMADLLRAAKLKKEQEESAPTIPPRGIPPETIPRRTIPKPTIPRPSIVSRTIVANQNEAPTITPNATSGVIVDASKGFFPFLNDLSDRVILELKLKPYEQVVLNRLIRLSHGWKSDECTVGLGALAKQCVMSRTSVQKSVVILVEKGLIEDLGEDKKGGKEGKRYKILPGATIPPRTIPQGTIVGDESTIVPRTTIKDTKELINTHTHTEGVRVGSKFSIEDCRKYAKHLQSTGEGINNPGGYATTIHRTGEADMMIESFLHPENSAPSPNLDVGQCPDCNGSGFFYPEGMEKGVKICKHEKLRRA